MASTSAVPTPASSTQRATVAARLDRLPPSRTVRKLVALISLGGAFEFYDLFLTAYIAPGLFKSGVFTATTKGLFGLEGIASFVAALFGGLWVGTLFVSWLSDRYGRKAIYTYSLLWYCLGTLIMAFQHTAMNIDIWRFIASIGIGVELVTIDSYVSEIAPSGRRGQYFAFNQFITFAAVPIVAFMGWALVPHEIAGLEGWRWVAIIGAIGSIFVWFIRLGIPESPRWLAQHGRVEEAERVVTELERKVQAETGQPLPEPRLLADEGELRQGRWAEIWSGEYSRRTIMLVLFNILQTVGYYGFASWAPTYLLSKGLDITKSLEYTFIIAIANPIGPLVAMAFADRFERKWQVGIAALVVAGAGLLFAHASTGLLIVFFGIVVTLANNWMSFSFHSYQSELYPTRIRAQAVGFVYSFSRISAVFSGFIIAWLLGRSGTTGVFTFIAAAMVCVFIVITSMGPRVTHRRLEDIAR